MTENATTYGESIAQTLRDLDDLANEIGQADADPDRLASLWESVGLTPTESDPGGMGVVWSWLDSQLDAEVLTGNRGRFRVEVLVTYGGPNAWVIYDTADGDGVVSVVCYWGGEKYERALVLPIVADTLHEYATVAESVLD